MRLIIPGLIAIVGLAACQGARCAETTPTLLTARKPVITTNQAEEVALNEVYARHPTRALVDIVTATRRSVRPGVFDVHVEMTGSPEARAIYDVVISEGADGELVVSGFTKVQ
ncbi:hypothetical protein [Henriciella pelagia]|jgi:hypothetical protein|uniref:Lipoprotein n=1 Tax=Henriciella pelagia TaxID=1977912 RepID=A0ABQ1JTW8_9PROT|nr:hypothetical protein [Henriciella pelagia]GGB74706.1 hypothetical protein GCM10011503_24250 [Henriciella pelagia]